LKDRGIHVLFNTNGTLLTKTNGQALIDAGLDELRVSLDAAEPTAFQMVRGKDMFDRIVSNVWRFRQMQVEQVKDLPRVSLWLTGLRETLDQLEAFVRIADSVGVREIYLQRLVFFTDNSNGMARAGSALFENTSREEELIIARATALAQSLNIAFSASGATEPEGSIKQKQSDAPWSLCRRPWSLMYFTATGRAIPCCVAPFSMRGYASFTLGDATQNTLREIWNGLEYQDFRRKLLSPAPPQTCANCGLRWSL
jgi:MoaA/NifB/PqqE/SkfB family radical SAM enzyme